MRRVEHHCIVEHLNILNISHYAKSAISYEMNASELIENLEEIVIYFRWEWWTIDFI